jgi:hypothetical protein
MDVSREHLYRNHSQQRLVCQRCGIVFKTLLFLQKHLRAEKPCKLNLHTPDGFNYEQEQQLKSKKGPRGEVAKWRHIYQILFPHVKEEEIPSPCKIVNQLITIPSLPFHNDSDVVNRCAI